MSLSLSVFSQSGPPKSVGGGGRGGVVSGLKLDEKSIENGLEGQKFLVVCLFWGGCHHPNTKKDDSNTFRNFLSAQELISLYYVQCGPAWILQVYTVTQQCCKSTGYKTKQSLAPSSYLIPRPISEEIFRMTLPGT